MAHIRRKHHLPAEPKRKCKASKPDAPASVSPLIVHGLININTQELESLLEDEEEFFELMNILSMMLASMLAWWIGII